MNLIKRLLEEGKWMVENSITFGDGSVLLLEKTKINNFSLIIKRQRKTNIDSLIIDDYDNFSFIDVLKVVKHDSFTAYMGEGSYGSDGFIYLVDNASSELMWFAFFDFSNPFIDAIINDDEIIATTNNETKWKFSLANPEIITVE